MRKTSVAASQFAPDLSGLSLELRHVRATTILRVTRRPGAELALDPTKVTRTGRYDDFRSPARYAVTYGADEILAGTAEARMLRSRHGAMIISEQHFQQALLVRYEADRELVMLGLTGGNALRLGAAEFMWQSDYDACQRFAAALHEARPDVDGLAYPSRKWPSAMCYAIFDRGVRSANLRAVEAVPLSAQLRSYVDEGEIVINASDLGDHE